MKDALIKINAYYNLIREIDTVRCEKFSQENPKHFKMLLEIWSGLLNDPEVKLDTLKNRKWRDLGFQGDDPSTDFRGMGMLALNSLK